MKSKTYILFFLLSVNLLAYGNGWIIPKPERMNATGEVFQLCGNVSVYAPDVFKSEAGFLRAELLRHQGLPIRIVADSVHADIVFRHQSVSDALYALELSSSGVAIISDDSEGAFYGVISFLQIVNSAPLISQAVYQLPGLTIFDKPVYPWRGLMLDESRHFFGVEKVKFLLDWMAYYKLNKFHWHLTDEPGWRIEIQKYPKLGHVGGIGNYTNEYTPAAFYSQNEIREIVAYAQERHIDVIPEIDMPGHAAAANRAYPEFSGGGSERYPDFTFHPGKEGTYAYLTDILREVDVLFPSQMIHLGGDEVHFGNHMWQSDEHVQKLMQTERLDDLKAVEDYFMSRMSDSLLHLNNWILAWDEMADANLPLDRSIIFWWRHDRIDQLKTSLSNGHQTVICPRLPFYFDFVQDDIHRVGRRWTENFNKLEDVYSFSLSGMGLSAMELSNVIGYQANVWTETINNESRLDYMIFPRLAAISEAVWTLDEEKDYDGFLERLKPHTELYRSQGIYFYNPFAANEFPEPPLIK